MLEIKAGLPLAYSTSHKRKRSYIHEHEHEHVDEIDSTNVDTPSCATSPQSSTSTNKIQRIDSYSSLVACNILIDDDIQDNANAINNASSHGLAGLPQELVFKIISYIGPRSSSLLNMSQLDTHFHRLMTRVGDAMLIRAQSNFRILLPKLHPVESSLSLFMRHARCCKEIESKCNQLKHILAKDCIVGSILGPVVVRSLRVTSPQGILQNNSDNNNNSDNHNKPVCVMNAVTLEEIDTALTIALEIIGQDVLSYFLATRHVMIKDVDENLIASERRNIIQHCSATLENRVLSLAGQCGGKVYKYIKMRQIIRTGCSNIDDTNDLGGKESAESKDEERMDRARLLMQLVICRDLELAKQDAEHGMSMSMGMGRRRFLVGGSRIFVQRNAGE